MKGVHINQMKAKSNSLQILEVVVMWFENKNILSDFKEEIQQGTTTAGYTLKMTSTGGHGSIRMMRVKDRKNNDIYI